MTKRSGTKKKSGKRQVNPMSRMTRVSRPKLGFNGQVLEAFTYAPSITTGGDGAGTQPLFIDCSTNNVASSVSGITQFYKEYVYESLKCEWIPAIGPASTLAGSQLYVTYDDNPEHMVTYTTNTASANNALQLLDNTTKIFNAWERVSFTIPLTRRRRMFDVNTTTAGGVDVNDRSTQGVLVLGFNTTVVSSSVGRWKLTYHIKLMGLAAVAT
jgi:hypothetical protein